jgi:hypothetical protein
MAWSIAALVVLLNLTCAYAKKQPELNVEVFKAETIHWTSYWKDEGSSGTTTTNCSGNDTGSNVSVNCKSETTGARQATSTPIYHTQVNMLVKMPDGNTAPMQCHFPPPWARCFQPQLGTYSAKINNRNIYLMIPQITGKQKYNKDGTLKEAAKTQIVEMKFSFQ